jgi:hypothetical protein
MTDPFAGQRIPLAAYGLALNAELETLPPRGRAAFAAACAERQYPAYAAFVLALGREDDGTVRRTLDRAWDLAASGIVSDPDTIGLIEQCAALIPDSEAVDSIPAHADDAIAAAAYALQAAAGLDERAAGWAAQRGTDGLDNYLLSNDIDDSLPDADQLVWSHPLVMAEVSRREADLRRLNTASSWQAAVDAVRADATGVSVLPLELLDHEV